MGTYLTKHRYYYKGDTPVFYLVGTFPIVKSIKELKYNIEEVYTNLIIKGFRAIKIPKITDFIYHFGYGEAVKAVNLLCDSAEDRGLDVVIPLFDKGILEDDSKVSLDEILDLVTSLSENLSKYVNVIYAIDNYIPQYPVIAEVRSRVAEILNICYESSKDKTLIFPGVPGDIFAEYTTKPAWLASWVLGYPIEDKLLASRYKFLGNKRPTKPMLGYQLDYTLDDPYTMRKYVWNGIFNKLAGVVVNTHDKHPEGEFMESLESIPILWKKLDLDNLSILTDTVIPASFKNLRLHAAVDGRSTGITVYGDDRSIISNIPLNLKYLRYEKVTIREYDLITGRVVLEEHDKQRSTAFLYTPSKHYTKDFIVQFTV